jgi:energy-coupling factor transporter ATP-binding protein EcfA2
LSQEDRNDSLKIRDLVEVPEIRTVIQLEDLKDPDLSSMIVETFVITSEVLKNLEAVLASLTGREGRGIFLKGHFGSGKSHFLGMISLLINTPRAWDTVLSQAPSLKDFRHKLDDLRFLVVERSMVQHRGSEFLEDIILRAVLEGLGEDAIREFDGLETRHETFSRLKVVLREKGFSGLVILVDELSEFLRSKTDARAYNEDIRFLQYLGEESVSFPLWVIASLQEWIEETGEIHQDTFNKIKDRYRIRLDLGRAHIEELVSERLILHKEGADSRISDIYDDLKSFFPQFPVTRERFIRLYPVHPATSSLLDRLKPLFSEHRGVVDFIHFRLKGDPERHIPPMMDQPARRLLTPEVIFDHFLDRIRERAETQVYIQRVFESCEEEIGRLFQDHDQRQVAMAAIKLLILFAVCPVQYKYSIRHMAEMILFEITSLEAEINYQFLWDILDQLAKEGLYIRVEKRDDHLDDHFYIDLKADMARIVRQRIRHKASQLFPEDRRLFWNTATMADSPYLPLGDWVEKGRQQVGVRWQHTQRSGTILLRQVEELSVDEIQGLFRQQERSEEDYFILVGTTHNRKDQYRHVKETLLPLIRERYRGIFLFWIPAPVEEDITWLKEVLAAILMEDAMQGGPGRDENEARGLLQAFLDEGKKRLTEHFNHHYYHGLLLWDENETDLSRFGFLIQEKFLSEFVPPLLERRFPKHGRIQPYMGTLAPGMLKDMLREFLLSGMLVVDERSKFGIRDVLDNLLKPMGLVKIKGNQYELHVNPKQNELARQFFKIMGERESVPLEEIYWNLRKSEYGLPWPHFEILILCLLFSGHVVAYKVMNRKTPEELSRTGLKGVTALGRGEIISEDFRQAMTGHPLIPKSFRDIPLTLASQEDLWAEIKSQKPAVIEDLASLKSRIQWAASFEAFKNMPWEGVLTDIEDLIAQWDEVKISLSSKEGLERFIRAGQREPFLEKKIETIQAAQAFLKKAERALFVYQYVTDQRLHIPDQDPYTWEAQTQEGGIREGDALDGYERLRTDRNDILGFYDERPDAVSPDVLEALLVRFQDFQDNYARAYVEAHQRVRGGNQFEPYDNLARSRRFHLLKRLDQLEMISVEHNHRTVNQALSSVLVHRCLRSPQDHLQAQPACTCGFRLGETTPFRPVKEIEEEIKRGISETLEALRAPAMQEKILPYLEGLDLVNRKEEADAIRQLLQMEPDQEVFLDQMDRILTSLVIRNINEAFRGKVVVVKRDLDQLYQSLIHRKYTLSQLRKILGDWLKEETIGDDTFLHFVGKGEGDPEDREKRDFKDFLDKDFSHLAPLYQEAGHTPFIKAAITAHWASHYSLPRLEMLEIFPFLERGAKEQTDQWIGHLEELGRTLYMEKRDLFESCVSETEEDAPLMQALWTRLSSWSPAQVFKEEPVFLHLLKEAFERVFCGESREADLKALISEPATPVSAGDSRFLQRRGEMIKALKTFYLFKEKKAALETAKDSPPETLAKWESFYIQTLSSLPFLKEKLHDDLRRFGLTIPLFLQEEERALVLQVQKTTQGFSAFYGPALAEWEQGQSDCPMMIQDIPSILSKKRHIPDHHRVCYILMDGMRWDLWESLKSDFFGKMPNLFRFVRQGALWANQPTNTSSQLTRFEEAFRAAYSDSEDVLFWKISGIDEKIHSEKGPLTHLFANIISYLEIDLLFRLRDLPSRTLLILFSDHGFVENPAFRPKDKYDAPRYIHGKDSPFEVIIPWAWIMRI